MTQKHRRALALLAVHHTKSPPSLRMATVPWNCSCGRKNSYKAEFCQQCGSSWLWTFGGKSSTPSNGSNWHGDWQEPPKTPRPRSKSRSRNSKGKGAGKSGKSNAKQGGKDQGYSTGDNAAPWRQSSSVLESLGISTPDTTEKSAMPTQHKENAGMDQVLNGLRNHLKSLGQEVTPEVEAFLMQKAGNKAQTIRMASQKLESSQRATTKLQNEISQQKQSWKKFQDKISEEYEAQRSKYQERIAALTEQLRKSGEDYAEAKRTLQDAANEQENPDKTEVTAVATAPPPAPVTPPIKSPKRKTEPEDEDALAKRLRQNVQEISDEEELMAAGTKQPFC